MKGTLIDRGTAWVRRRFAKPPSTGSIPAPVSKRFPQDYTNQELASLVLEHRNASIEKGTKVIELTEKLIAVQRELSELKRKKNNQGG